MYLFLLLFLGSLLPSVAFAAGSLETFLFKVNTQIINPLIVFLFALALVYFLWGTLQFLLDGANQEKRATGKQHMIWGVIGLTIMMAVFTIMHIILSTLGITGINVDTVPKSGSIKLDDYSPNYPDLKTK